jgi:hypothetical protein
MRKVARIIKRFVGFAVTFVGFAVTAKELKRALWLFLFFLAWPVLTLMFGNPLQVFTSLRGTSGVLFYAVCSTLIMVISDYSQWRRHSGTPRKRRE